MKIYYNCTSLHKWTRKPSGIQRVVEEIGRSFELSGSGVMPCIFLPDGQCRAYGVSRREVGEQLILSTQDIIFSAGHDWDYLPELDVLKSYVKKGVKFGCLFHDTIPTRFPFTYTADFVERFSSWLSWAIDASQVNFAVSRNTASDLETYARSQSISFEHISVVRLGDDFSRSSGDVVPTSKVDNGDFILSVGTIEFRKNHQILLGAYRHIIDELNLQPPKLVIVGRESRFDGGLRKQIEADMRLRDLVTIVSGLGDDELIALYQAAMFTVYPSIYEGWGLPVVESLRQGKPCVVSNTSSMLEIAPALTRFAHPLVAKEWAEHIADLMDGASRALEMTQIRQQYSHSTWDTTTSSILDAFRKTFPGIDQ